METAVSNITPKSPTQPLNPVPPLLSVIDEIRTMRASSAYLLPEFLLHTVSNIILISEDHRTLGFLDREKINGVPDAELPLVIIVIVAYRTLT